MESALLSNLLKTQLPIGPATNLKQYRRLNRKWQFVPVVNENGKPNPKLVLIDRRPFRSKAAISCIEFVQSETAHKVGADHVQWTTCVGPGQNSSCSTDSGEVPL